MSDSVSLGSNRTCLQYYAAVLCHDLHRLGNTHYSRNSPTVPLPLIPRRLAPLPGSRRLSTLIAPHVDPPSSGVILTRASPPTTPDPSDSASTLVRVLPPTPTSATEAEHSSTPSLPSTHHSSTSESVSQPVPPRRVRGQRFPALRPPEQSTPTPARADFRDDTPFTPRQSPAVILSRNLSESHVHALAAAAVARSEPMPLLPRKKSGEPLKSSLKAKRTPARGSLTVITDPVGLSSSKSAPATPAHKGVRFDSQLEHVKLFLAEQKPLAVSRDGSPTDTSGTESEFPSFIYGRSDGFKERPLVMHRIDVPAALSWQKIHVMSLSRTSSWLGPRLRVLFACPISHSKNGLRCALRPTSGRQHRRSPHGTRSPFSMAPWTPLSSQSNWQTFFPARRRRPSITLSDIRLPAAKSGTITVVETTTSKSCARRCRRLTKRPWLRSLRSLPMRRISRICGINSSRHSSLAGSSETVGGILAQHSRRLWGLPSPTPSPPPRRDPTPSFKSEGSLAARYDFPHRCVHPGAFSLAHTHLP